MRRFLALIAALVVLGLVDPVSGQGPAFHDGKTIRIIVGLAAGGGYDTYARLVARHLGRHVPGKPGVIVENMTGAGGLIAANHLYKIAKPDGLTIGHFNGSHMMGQVLGAPGIEFDAGNSSSWGPPSRRTSSAGSRRRAASPASRSGWRPAPRSSSAVSPPAVPSTTAPRS